MMQVEFSGAAPWLYEEGWMLPDEEPCEKDVPSLTGDEQHDCTFRPQSLVNI